MYLWIKAFHLIAVICWFAALLYLPRLFVYHSMSDDQTSKDRFKVMERKLYRGIMTPSMAITIVLGFYLWSQIGASVGGWLHLKLVLVAVLVAYHIYCGKLMRQFAQDSNTKSHVFFRWFNELPAVLLIIIVVLAVVKPF